MIVCFFFFFHFLLFFYFFNCKKNGVTPLYIAAQEGKEQIVQILLEKGGADADLADKVVILLILFFHFFFFLFLIFFYFFFNVKKDGTTPLYIATQEGHEQIVQILLEKGGANVDFAMKVLFC